MGKLKDNYSGNAARIAGLPRSKISEMLDKAEEFLEEVGIDVNEFVEGEKTRDFLRLYLLMPEEVRKKMEEYIKGRYNMPHLLFGPKDLAEFVDFLRKLGDTRIGGGRGWRWWRRLSRVKTLEELISTLESLGDVEVLGMRGREWAERFRSGGYTLEKALEEIEERAGRPAKEWADYFIRKGLKDRDFNLERALRELEMGGEEEAMENLRRLGIGKPTARRVVEEPIKAGLNLPPKILSYLFSLPPELRRYMFYILSYRLGKGEKIDSQAVYKALPVNLALLYLSGYLKSEDVDDVLTLLAKVNEGLDKLKEVYPEVFWGVEVERGVKLSRDEIANIQDGLRRRGIPMKAGAVRRLLSETLNSPLGDKVWEAILQRRWSKVADLLAGYVREKGKTKLLARIPEQVREKLGRLPEELREEVLEYLERRDLKPPRSLMKLKPRLAFLLAYLGLAGHPEMYSDHLVRGWEELREKYPDLFGEKPGFILEGLPPAWDIKDMLRRAGSKNPEEDFSRLLREHGEEFLEILRTRPKGYLRRLRGLLEEWHRVPVSGRDEEGEVKVRVLGEADLLTEVIQEITRISRKKARDIARDLLRGSLKLTPSDESERPLRFLLYKLMDKGIVVFYPGWREEKWSLRREWRESARRTLEKELKALEQEILRRKEVRYVCSHCGIGYSEEKALEHHFTCRKCGALITTLDEETEGAEKYKKFLRAMERRRERLEELIQAL